MMYSRWAIRPFSFMKIPSLITAHNPTSEPGRRDRGPHIGWRGGVVGGAMMESGPLVRRPRRPSSPVLFPARRGAK